MKKIKGIIAVSSIALMMVCFFVSWLFFMGSGIIDDDWEADEARIVEIARELDKLPLMYFNDEVEFREYGHVTDVTNDTLTITWKDESFLFYHSKNLSSLKPNDFIMVRYTYDSDYKKEIILIRDEKHRIIVR